MLERALAVALAATLLVGTTLLPDARAQTADPSDFATTDLNADGQIDREEYHRRMMDTMFFADADGDGMLTMDELPAADPGRFQAADRNGDGMLSYRRVHRCPVRGFRHRGSGRQRYAEPCRGRRLALSGLR